MKKLMAMMLAVAVMFGAGGFVPVDHADAKGYKSGKRSFQPTQPSQNTPAPNQSQFNNSNSVKTPAKNTAPAPAQKSTGGFMKGLVFGGLAGLLLGGLLGNMGALGDIIGLLVNVMFVVLIIGIVRKLYTTYKQRKQEKEADAWRR